MKKPEGYNERENAKRIERFDLEKRIEKLIQALIDCTGKTVTQARDELMVLDLGDENLTLVVHAAMRLERINKGESY